MTVSASGPAQRVVRRLRSAASMLRHEARLQRTRAAVVASLSTTAVALVAIMTGALVAWPAWMLLLSAVIALTAATVGVLWPVADIRTRPDNRRARRQNAAARSARRNGENSHRARPGGDKRGRQLDNKRNRAWRRSVVRIHDHFQAANRVVLRPEPSDYRVGPGSGWEPQISVIVPAFNRADLLAQTLSSVQLQDFVDWECIVVDDASTDHVYEVAHQFAMRDSRFRIVCHDVNGQLAASRNTGLLHARSDIVTFLDGDDILFPSALSSRLAAWDHHAEPAFAGVYCSWQPFFGTHVPKIPARKPPRLNRVTALTVPWDCPFISSAPIMRKDVAVALGGFDEKLRTAEDADFWARVLRAGYYFEYAPYVGIAYRQVPQSMLRRTLVPHTAHMIALAQSLESDIDDDAVLNGPLPMDRPLSSYVRGRALAPRLVRFLVMSLASGDEEGAQRIAEAIDPVVVALHPDPRFAEHATEAALQRLGLRDVRFARETADIRLSSREVLQRLAGQAMEHKRSLPALQPSSRAATDLRARTASVDDSRRVRAISTRLRTVGLGGGDGSAEGSVVLLAEARYHVDELGPLGEALQRRGMKPIFMARSSDGAVGKALREQVLSELMKYTDTVWEWDPDLPARTSLSGVVVLNDWGPARELVETAAAHGAVTFAKVEGVQDFDDRDTGRRRAPYRTAQVVLGQGRNDVIALPDCDVRIIGSSRLERVAQARPSSRERLVAINLNFTYNVQTEHADQWLRSVIEACHQADVAYTISPHPAQQRQLVDEALTAHGVATDPMRHVLTHAGVLVTRFSTVVYEAIARDVPVIYHNPHSERVWEHVADSGLPVTTSTSQLVANLRRVLDDLPDMSAQQAFFGAQVDIDDKRPSADRAADVIAANCRRHGRDPAGSKSGEREQELPVRGA